MRILKHFESFEPNPSEVESIKNFLAMAYPVKTSSVYTGTYLSSESKFVMVDYKPFYITGKYVIANKSKLVDALSFELEGHFPLFSEASIRKAAKDFFEFHSK